MAYNDYKDTSNPIVPEVKDKWHDLLTFEGDTVVEKIVSTISKTIVLLLLIVLIPLGVVISIYNSLYNLQKSAYDDLDDDNMFSKSVELGIYILLSIPFLLIMIPYWIFAPIWAWLAKHKVLIIIIIIIIVVFFVFKDSIMLFFNSLYANTNIE